MRSGNFDFRILFYASELTIVRRSLQLIYTLISLKIIILSPCITFSQCHYGICSGGSSMGLAPHLNFCQPHQLTPSAKLVYYIYLTSTTRLLLRRSMNIKLSNYLIPQLRIDYDGKLVIIDRLWEGSPLL